MTLAVVMLTYASGLDSPRHEYAKITAKSLVENLKYSGEIHWHIAHDGSPPECVVESEFPTATVTDSERRGYGASYNLATQALHSYCEYLLMVEDDWKLVRPLDLDCLVSALREGSQINCVRLGYLGWTQRLSGDIVKEADQTFLLMDPESPEPHVWAGHPRLETREFQRKIGIWPEGEDPGTTEFIVAKREASRHGVAWPLDLTLNASQQWANTFAHIGAVTARSDRN
jgi:hypothetical protein